MKIGLLSDAHGNDRGLRLCIDFLNRQKVDRFFFLGDAVGYFPEPNKTMKLLNEVEAVCLLGNHDAMLLGSLACTPERDEVCQIRLSREALSEAYRRQLAERAPTWVMELEGKKILMAHGSPDDPLKGYVYPDSDLTPFADQPFAAVFMGHTHRPFISNQSGVIVLNAGSCGLPRDQGDLASCALYDTESGAADIFRVPMEVGRLIDQYRGRLHQSVLSCLMRKSKATVFGKVTGQ